MKTILSFVLLVALAGCGGWYPPSIHSGIPHKLELAYNATSLGESRVVHHYLSDSIVTTINREEELIVLRTLDYKTYQSMYKDDEGAEFKYTNIVALASLNEGDRLLRRDALGIVSEGYKDYRVTITNALEKEQKASLSNTGDVITMTLQTLSLLR